MDLVFVRGNSCHERISLRSVAAFICGSQGGSTLWLIIIHILVDYHRAFTGVDRGSAEGGRNTGEWDAAESLA